MKRSLVLVLSLLAPLLLEPARSQPTQTQNAPFILAQKDGRISGGFGQGLGRKSGGCPPLPDDLLLTALVPKTDQAVIGQTISDHPVFWFYVPYTRETRIPARFSLQDQQDKIVYETSVPLPPTTGIISVRIPPTVKPLAMNQAYRWTLQLDCTRPAPFVQGWVERVTPPAAVANIASLPAPQQALIYMQHRLWFDALSTLGKARRTQPNNSTLDAAWMQLFNQEKFDLRPENQTKLETIIRQPIVQ